MEWIECWSKRAGQIEREASDITQCAKQIANGPPAGQSVDALQVKGTKVE